MKALKKKDEEQDPTKPLEEPASDSQSDDAEKADSVSSEEDSKLESEEDRSAFNCGSCGGEGLVWHDGVKRHERCSACGGSGKVN